MSDLSRVAPGRRHVRRGRVRGNNGFPDPRTHAHFPVWIISFFLLLFEATSSLSSPSSAQAKYCFSSCQVAALRKSSGKKDRLKILK